MTRRAPISTLFPYTTLFRSLWLSQGDIKQRRDCGRQIERFPLRVRRDVPSAIKDRKSTRLNSSHVSISYAVFCLKKNNVPAPPDAAGQDRAPPPQRAGLRDR